MRFLCPAASNAEHSTIAIKVAPVNSGNFVLPHQARGDEDGQVEDSLSL